MGTAKPTLVASVLVVAISAQTPAQNSRIVEAARLGDVGQLELLLRAGVPVDATEGTGKTPLMAAAASGNIAAVRMLLDKGASVNSKDKQNLTPLAAAAYSGNTEVVGAILARKPATDWSSGPLSPLTVAQVGGHYAVAQILYDQAVNELPRGHPALLIATANFGQMYLNGKGVPPDIARAAQFFRSAAEGGLLYAKALLGQFTWDGTGVAKDPELGLRLLQEAADAGHPGALNALGVIYSTGHPRAPQDYARALKYYLAAAAKGEPKAQYHAAMAHLRGRGTPVDEKEAVRLIRLAAEGGYAVAAFNLGSMLAGARFGVTRDDRAAYLWFLIAEKQAGSSSSSLNAPEVNDGMAQLRSQVRTNLDLVSRRLSQADRLRTEREFATWRPRANEYEFEMRWPGDGKLSAVRPHS